MGLKELVTKKHQEMALASNSNIVANCYNQSGNRVEFCKKVAVRLRVGEISNKLPIPSVCDGAPHGAPRQD